MIKEQSPNNNTKHSSNEIAKAVLEGFKNIQPEKDLIPKEKLQEWLNS